MNTNEPIYVSPPIPAWLGNEGNTFARYCFTPSMCVSFFDERNPPERGMCGAFILVNSGDVGRDGSSHYYNHFFTFQDLEVHHSRSLADVMLEVTREGDNAFIPIPQNLIRSAA